MNINKVLRKKINKQMDRLGLNNAEKEQLVIELDALSSLIVNSYIVKQNGK